LIYADISGNHVTARVIKAAEPSRSHAAGQTSTSLVSDAETCPTRKTLRPLKLPVVAPALAELALVATMIADVPESKNLPTNDLQAAHALQALFEAALPCMPETVASDTDASGTDPSLIDSQASDASDDHD